MDRESIKHRLRAYLMETNSVSRREIADDASLFDANLLDSLGIVRLVTFMEEEYSCNFDFDELTEENLSTLDTISALVVRKKGI